MGVFPLQLGDRRLEFGHLLPEKALGQDHLVAAELSFLDQGGDAAERLVSGLIPGQDADLRGPGDASRGRAK